MAKTQRTLDAPRCRTHLLRGDAGANDPVFAWHKGRWLTERSVNYMLKRTATLGRANVAMTSGYLHARPNTLSGLKLDEGIFR